MIGWQEPYNNIRIYVVEDCSAMEHFYDYIQPYDVHKIYISSETDKSKINLRIHYYNGKLYSSSLTGIVRIKTIDGESIYDSEGNELIIKVVPRFSFDIINILNFIKDDDEFDRYLAPQTTNSRNNELDIEEIGDTELFSFFQNELPLKVEDTVSKESGIITVISFLSALKDLCRKPLMSKTLKKECNLNGKVKGKINVQKNIRYNTTHGRNERFYCEYLERTDNIPENQYLKYALYKAMHFISQYFGYLSYGNNSISSMISYCMNATKHIDLVKYASNDCKSFKFSGCYAHYRSVVMLAQMILNDISINANGLSVTSGYIIPYAVSMEKVFEVYVRTYLKKHGIKSYKENCQSGIRLEKYDKKFDVLRDDNIPVNPGKYIAGPVKPDILLTHIDTQSTTVFDVKYKKAIWYNKEGKKNSNYSRQDRLQLLAYSMMFNADDIGLIFPVFEQEEVFGERIVNSMEKRAVKYHQLLLDSDNSKSDVADYIIKICLSK